MERSVGKGQDASPLDCINATGSEWFCVKDVTEWHFF